MKIAMHEIQDAGAALLAALGEPFAANEIRWRVGSSGYIKGDEKRPWAKVLAYVDARLVRERLNEVCGPINWTVKYRTASDGKGFIATLALRVNGEWIEKEDGADATDVEALKGGLSDALKRAAVTWGIGEYLYSFGESFAEFFDSKGQPFQKAKYSSEIKSKDGKIKAYWQWNPPALSAKHLPGHNDPPTPPAQQARSTRTSTPPAQTKPAATTQPPAAEKPSGSRPKTKGERSADFIMPFGHGAIKGKRLGDCSMEDLQRAYDWGKANNKNYTDFYEAFESLSNTLISQGTGVDPRDPGGHGEYPHGLPEDDFPDALRDQDDDLPF